MSKKLLLKVIPLLFFCLVFFSSATYSQNPPTKTPLTEVEIQSLNMKLRGELLKKKEGCGITKGEETGVFEKKAVYFDKTGRKEQ